MALDALIDAAMLVIGIAGCVGSLSGRRPFINEAQMGTLIARFGRQPIRAAAATGYLLVGLIGGLRLLGI